MSRSIAGKIKLNNFADLVGGDDTAITDVPLSDLHEFKNHPFRVLDDEKMDEMVESVKTNGILNPGIVRPRMEGGGYELIAGHRRKRACELAGLETMPVVIRNYSDDEATVVMVDTNLQREIILPSEKAHAYRMKFDAMSHQGSEGGNTLEEISEDAGESAKTVQRYIALSKLTDGLLAMVDEKKLAIRAGVELSYLKDKEQEWVETIMNEEEVLVSPDQASKIRNYSQNKELTKGLVHEILSEEKSKPRKVSLKTETINQYFDDDYSSEEIEETIIRLLEEWKEKGGR
ncbi:MAG: ParB/RepB/Spo0J family partition protein [Butyrivibrio sp.]|nr:ParB/RepB/Spo0J family partition protein [Butyrivibrio sp.]